MNLIGQTLGEYQIVEEIGRGGMATVYKAYQPALERYVALKVLPIYFQHDAEFLQRFHHEAKAAARLNHPNIVRIYGAGESRGLNYMAMEYADGGSLWDRLAAGRPLDLTEAVRIISQVAAALDYAHRRGVIHRDIKPSNILLTGDGRVLLSDFGIAKVSEFSKLTRSGTFLGTAEYTSPEQVESQPVDARSDLYSLGVVLYQMLTGRVPFSGETMQAVMYAHCRKTPPPPTHFDRSLPKSVEAVVLKALSKRKTDRFQSGQEMVVALREAMREPVRRPPLLPVDQKPIRLSSRLAALPPLRLAAAVLGASVVICLVTVGVVSLLRGPAPSMPRPTFVQPGTAETRQLGQPGSPTQTAVALTSTALPLVQTPWTSPTEGRATEARSVVLTATPSPVSTSPPPTDTPPVPPLSDELEPVTHRVVDTWETPEFIAGLYACVTAEQIREANSLSSVTDFPGEGVDLIIPLPPERVAKASRRHIVKSWDQGIGIAVHYGVTWQDIVQLNCLARPDGTNLLPGQMLLIP